MLFYKREKAGTSHFTGTEYTACAICNRRAGTRSMPCLLVTVGSPARITGFPFGKRSSRVATRQTLFDRARGWLSRRLQLPGSHQPWLAVPVPNLYSSLATSIYCDMSSIMVRRRIVKQFTDWDHCPERSLFPAQYHSLAGQRQMSIAHFYQGNLVRPPRSLSEPPSQNYRFRCCPHHC
jgi:hypothetical protein